MDALVDEAEGSSAQPMHVGAAPPRAWGSRSFHAQPGDSSIVMTGSHVGLSGIGLGEADHIAGTVDFEAC
jgi:hypothetical protein